MNKQIVSSQTICDFSFVQLRVQPADSFQYKTLSSAMAEGFIEIREVHQGGNVNRLMAINRSDFFIFLMDGDILVGAKQNRVLNTSILLAPKSETIIPVSCVERGRWRHVSPQFASSPDIAHAKLRAFKSRSVASHLKSGEAHLADQAGVWEQVQCCALAAKTESPTESLSDVFAKKRAEFEASAASLCPARDANGLAIFRGGRMVSLDLFHRAEVLADYLPKLARGALMESVFDESHQMAPPLPELEAKALAALERVAHSPGETHPAVSVGSERRFEDAQCVGFELKHEAYSIHLSILPRDSD